MTPCCVFFYGDYKLINLIKMKELIKLLEKEQDVFESKHVLEEIGFEKGLQKSIEIVKLYAISDVSKLLLEFGKKVAEDMLRSDKIMNIEKSYEEFKSNL